MNNKIALLLFMLLIGRSISAQVHPRLVLTQFAALGTAARPTNIQNCGDNRLFVTYQGGTVHILDSAGNINATPFIDITPKVYFPGTNGAEQGLLGIAFSPNYAVDGTFYLDYTDYVTKNTHLSRFHRSTSNPNVADTAEEIILNIWDPYYNHNGGHPNFGVDGYMYVGYGDGGSGGDPQNRSQTLDTLWGKMLRLDVSGPTGYTVPPSNPFVNNPSARPEVWAYGLRNPWGWSFDRITHDMWIGDVGQNLWEEVDFQPAGDPGGENYGWHCYEGTHLYGTACTLPSYTHPVFEYSHGTVNGCSITGGYVYRGAKYADLFGRFLFTDYCSGRFLSTRSDGAGGWITDTLTTTTAVSLNDYGTFGQDICGELYIAGNNTGKIWKISDTTCVPVAFISSADTITGCGSVSLSALMGCYTNYTYQWQKDSVSIPGAVSSGYNATQDGNYSVMVTNGSCSSVSSSKHVTIIPLPTVNFSGLAGIYCTYSSPVSLVGTPSGGTFSGAGISGNTFSPGTAGAGTFAINYTYTDTTTGCSNTATQQVTVSLCIGIEEESLVASDISIYPNPNKANFTFEFYLPKKETVELKVTNMLGQTVYSEVKEFQKGKNQHLIKIDKAASGSYFIHLKTSRGQLSRKFEVNK